MSGQSRLSLIPIVDKTRISRSISVTEAADKAFKARLERTELEAQVNSKRVAEMKRRELDAEEEEKILTKIQAMREKERKAYLQEIAAIDGQGRIRDDSRMRQQEIARRLEEIRIDEARQKDEDAAKQKRRLLELISEPDFSCQRPIMSSYYSTRRWNGPSDSDPLQWFHSLQATLHQIYLQAPLPQLREISRSLEAESLRVRDVIRYRFSRDV